MLGRLVVKLTRLIHWLEKIDGALEVIRIQSSELKMVAPSPIFFEIRGQMVQEYRRVWMDFGGLPRLFQHVRIFEAAKQ